MEKYQARPIYGVLGAKLPEAYKLHIGDKPVFVLGPYTTACGGCDRILPFSLIPELIIKYAEKGHVVFEGFLMSNSYGVVGQVMECWQQQAVVMFLDTPVEVCIERVLARRRARGTKREFNPKLLTQKHKMIANMKPRIEEGGMCAITIRDTDAFGEIVGLLARAK